MNWSKSRKWNALKTAKICLIKGYQVLLMNQNQQGAEEILDNARIKKIRENFNELSDKFLKPKIKEIRRNLYETENK